jgi:hypothetical protein
MIDYKALLECYIKYVVYEEGTSFVDSFSVSEDMPQEWFDELVRIDAMQRDAWRANK